MSKIHPYLRFNDKKCREAFSFYKEALGGGEIKFQTVGESPMAKEMPADGQDFIMHAELKKGDLEIYGSDMMRDKAIIGDNVVVSLNVDSEEEIHSVFKKLSKGGEVFMAPEKTFWGAIFGMVTDKYGIEWMLNFQMEEYFKGGKK